MRALAEQLELAWSLGREHVLPAAAAGDVYWAPSGNVCTVSLTADGAWRADLPDETIEPLPNVTVAWLLWHITWWWSNAGRWAVGEPGLAPGDVTCPGSAVDAIGRVNDLHDAWTGTLLRGGPHDPTCAPFAHGSTLAGLTTWVTFELTKNLAEIGVLTVLQRNGGPGLSVRRCGGC